jgi:hypothetical protein
MSVELLPCPFCAGAASVRQWTDHEEGSRAFLFQRFGAGCHAHSDVIGMVADTEAEAIAAWNTRATGSAIERLEALNAELLEAAREALHQIDKYAEFFCHEDFDPTVDLLRAAISKANLPASGIGSDINE